MLHLGLAAEPLHFVLEVPAIVLVVNSDFGSRSMILVLCDGCGPRRDLFMKSITRPRCPPLPSPSERLAMAISSGNAGQYRRRNGRQPAVSAGIIALALTDRCFFSSFISWPAELFSSMLVDRGPHAVRRRVPRRLVCGDPLDQTQQLSVHVSTAMR